MYLISGNGPTADWYLNMLADPVVTVKLAGEQRIGRASAVTDIEERHRCGDMMGAKYVWDGDPSIGLTYQAWCYDVPAIAIDFPTPIQATEFSRRAWRTGVPDAAESRHDDVV